MSQAPLGHLKKQKAIKKLLTNRKTSAIINTERTKERKKEMLVRELMEVLAQYDGDVQVEVVGGGSDWADWGFLKVGQDRLLEFREEFSEEDE